MHILFIHGIGSKYGGYLSLLGLITALRDIDPDLEISIALSKKGDSGHRFHELEELGCRICDIPYAFYMQEKPEKRWKLPLRFIRRGVPYLSCRARFMGSLKEQMELETVDLIHSNSSRDDYGAILSRRLGVPLVWHIREFGDLDFKCYGYRLRPGSFMKKSGGSFIAISEAVRQHWIGKGVPAERIITIYDGVAVKGRQPLEAKETDRRQENPGSNTLSLVMVGRMEAAKGQHLAIQAIGRLPDSHRERVRLDIIGDGDPLYRRRLDELTEHFRLKGSVRFLGYQRDFFSRLACYDCGLVCSECEGFGRVTAEYMLAGLPVLASDTGANPEVVQDGRTGLLFSYPDTDALRDKLAFMLENPDKRKEMGAAAREDAQKRFTAEKNAETVYRLYRSILSLPDEETVPLKRRKR